MSYLLHTKDKGLVFDHSNNEGRLDLTAPSDADFASEESYRRSHTGVWLGVNGSPVYRRDNHDQRQHNQPLYSAGPGLDQ